MSNFKKQLLLAAPKSFFSGLGVLSLGFKEARARKSLFVLSILPICISLLSLYFFYGLIYENAFSYLKLRFVAEEAFDFLAGFLVLKAVFFGLKVLTALVVFLTFYILLQIVYIPFCALLAEKVLKDKGILKINGFGEALAYNIRMFKVGLLKSVLLLFAGLVCFASSFLAPLAFLPAYFAFLVLSYDSFDYGLELYGYSLKERSDFIKKEFAILNGHGAVLFLISFVPGLLLLTLPFSVIGASLKLGEHYELKREIT